MVVMMAALVGCNANAQDERKAMNDDFRQDREFMDQAIKQRSPDVMKVDVVDNTVLYTHIYDGIIDVKAYTFNGNECVKVERIYTFPNQQKALKHYRNAIERAELYDNIELLKNQVKYTLKQEQYKLETKGLTKDQLKAKFEKEVADVKADLKRDFDKCDKKGCCKKGKCPKK